LDYTEHKLNSIRGLTTMLIHKQLTH